MYVEKKILTHRLILHVGVGKKRDLVFRLTLYYLHSQQNTDVFWKPTLALNSDPGSFIVALQSGLSGYHCDPEWGKLLKERDAEKEEANK